MSFEPTMTWLSILSPVIRNVATPTAAGGDRAVAYRMQRRSAGAERLLEQPESRPRRVAVAPIERDRAIVAPRDLQRDVRAAAAHRFALGLRQQSRTDAAGAMLGQHEELVDLRRHAPVLEAEDVDEAQVPERLLRLGGDPHGTKGGRRQQALQRRLQCGRLEAVQALEDPVLGDERQER